MVYSNNDSSAQMISYNTYGVGKDAHLYEQSCNTCMDMDIFKLHAKRKLVKSSEETTTHAEVFSLLKVEATGWNMFFLSMCTRRHKLAQTKVLKKGDEKELFGMYLGIREILAVQEMDFT